MRNSSRTQPKRERNEKYVRRVVLKGYTQKLQSMSNCSPTGKEWNERWRGIF